MIKTLLEQIDIKELSEDLRKMFEKENIDFSKMNFLFGSITFFLERSKKEEFPYNLGLLFLIENYLSFYMLRKLIEELHKAHKYDEASKYRKMKPKDIPPLGCLLKKLKIYLLDENLITALDKIIQDRNELTHHLAYASIDSDDILARANELSESIYKQFWEISSRLIPS